VLELQLLMTGLSLNSSDLIRKSWDDTKDKMRHGRMALLFYFPTLL
jgi:hypothetical protein